MTASGFLPASFALLQTGQPVPDLARYDDAWDYWFQFRAEQQSDPALARIPVAVITGVSYPTATTELYARQRTFEHTESVLGVVERYCD